jgi:hypothetical protein
MAFSIGHIGLRSPLNGVPHITLPINKPKFRTLNGEQSSASLAVGGVAGNPWRGFTQWARRLPGEVQIVLDRRTKRSKQNFRRAEPKLLFLSFKNKPVVQIKVATRGFKTGGASRRYSLRVRSISGSPFPRLIQPAAAVLR